MPLPDVLGSITPVKSPRVFLTGGLVPGAEIPPVGVPFPGSWGESMGDCAGMRVMSVGDAAALGAMRQRIFLSLTNQKNLHFLPDLLGFLAHPEFHQHD